MTYVWPEIGALAVSVPPSNVFDLISDPFVAAVEVDQQGSANGGDPDGAGSQPAQSAIVPLFDPRAPLVSWNLSMAMTPGPGFDGTGVTVAIIDSGLPENWSEFLPEGVVDLDHAAGFGAEGRRSPLGGTKAIRGAGGHVGLFPHGLAVPSVIAGFSSELGPVSGAAPGAKILPIRVLNQFNFGWFSWFTAAVLHVAHLKADAILMGPVVINFSIEARGQSAILRDAIDYAISRGVLFVTIAGNFGPAPGSIAFPRIAAAGHHGRSWLELAILEPALVLAAGSPQRPDAGLPAAVLGSGESRRSASGSLGRDSPRDARWRSMLSTTRACPRSACGASDSAALITESSAQPFGVGSSASSWAVASTLGC